MKQCVCSKARCVKGVGSVERIQYDRQGGKGKIRIMYDKCHDAKWEGEKEE